MRERLAFALAVMAIVSVFALAVCLHGDEPAVGAGSALPESLEVPEAAPVYPVPGLESPDREVAPSYEAPAIPDVQFTTKEYAPATQAKYRENGIVVGQPKLFELRSLQMMIDSVKTSLAQTTYPNTSQLFGSTGRVQASESTSTDTAVDVGVEAGAGGAAGSRARPSVSEGSRSGSETQGGLALSPTDVLAEQTSLWYQLVNLQMLMDGALSDRLIPADENGAATIFGNSSKFSPRAQAIIGFQISVDSREEYRNAVAEAIIAIDNKQPALSGQGGYGDEPSLMLLLPRSNTYNSVSVTRDSKSLGFGAIANVFSLGMSREKKGETFYIGKDTDTVALERIPSLPIYGTAEPVREGQTARYRGVSFGWQFRPVFTRTAVEPGIRQVFATLSLPASVMQDKWEGSIHVTTYWRRYDRKNRTVGKVIEGSLNKWRLDNIVVPIGSGIEEALQPNIARAMWEDAGNGKVAVTIEGSNFSLGTSIACGETTIYEKELTLFSSNRIRFVLPLTAVSRGGITVIGRYGVANLKSCLVKNDDPYAGVKVSSPKFTQQGDQTTTVELILSDVQNPMRLISDRCPVIQLNGEVFGAADKPLTSISMDEAGKTVTIRFSAPAQSLAKTDEIVVRDLLGYTALSARW